jgi:phosphoribosylformylglycinamidine cyclo-ligase
LDFPAQTDNGTERIARVSDADAYAKAGVDQGAADSAVAGLVRALGTIELGRPSRQVPLPGHYASVIRIDERTGIALSTDGVGTKLLVAEQLGRFDTVGIDCVAMNVNDVICVGAEPLAMLDYIAIERADPAVCEQIGVGLARGAELAGIEIPGGELAQLGEMVRGFDVAGACFGTVALDAIVDGSAVQPGDPVIGLPSSGIHSNGYTLARSALDGIPLDEDPAGRLGRSLGEELLEPTEIYVKPVLELLRSEVEVRGLAHITSGGLGNLNRLAAAVGYEIDDPLPVPPIFELIRERASVPDEEMHDIFNMGCGFCCVVSPEHEDAALDLLRAHYPAARRIGRAAAGPHEIVQS